ncbi:hypothetical protein [uncultured Jatrophihabitans sp.]|uniref:hypothetical protein n=1 Tax=uncultured Jatrophihabitans sp. TaxID=1610747 RepID=UPI0035CB92AA
MPGFTVRPDDLHRAGQALEQSGRDLHEQWQALKARTQSIKFGTTDTVSPLIQMTLMGAVLIADDCFGSSKGALTNHAAALQNAAGHYSNAEATNVGLFGAGE